MPEQRSEGISGQQPAGSGWGGAPAEPPASGTEQPEGSAVQRSSWARLASALRPGVKRGHVLPALLCAVLGFAVVVQVRSTNETGLEGLRQTDLVRILDDVTARTARLRQEARDLEDTRARLTNSSTGTRAALQDAQERVRVLGILAGTLPARGPGIQLTISDPRGKVGSEVLLDTLQELRDAGAEAVEVGTLNGPAVRVVANTAFTDPLDGSGVEVDGTLLTSPYRFLVIGDPRTLAAALDIPGGVLDVLRQDDAQGVVTQRDSVAIDSLRAAPSPRYARPADGAASRGGDRTSRE